jgi:hypothetical protein
MSDKNQRRPLTPPATPAPTTAPVKEAAKETPKATPIPEVQAEEQSAGSEMEVSAFVADEFPIPDADVIADQMSNLRGAMLDLKSRFDDTLRIYWHLPMSRETIYAAGGMSATIDRLVGSIERDAGDYAATVKE